MGLFKSTLTLTLLLISRLLGNFSSQPAAQVLYWMHKGQVDRAIDTYLEEASKTESDDFGLLQEACLLLLEEGSQSEDLETQLMCMYGAGIALNPRLIPILGKGIRSKEMRIQLVALHFLERLNDDEANLLIHDALSSPFLLVRLEAMALLAERNDLEVIEQMESLYYKIPAKAKMLLSTIATKVHSESSLRLLKTMLSDEDLEVRLITILEIGEEKRDELIDPIRKLASFPNIQYQEACAFTLGKLKDSLSKEWLLTQSKATSHHLRLAALNSLKELGDFNAFQEILKMAEDKNLFALNLIGEDEDCPECLLKALSQEEDFDCQLNANLFLLKRGDPNALAFFKPFLTEEKECGFMKQFSFGKTLNFWKAVPSPKEKAAFFPSLPHETSLFQMELLLGLGELPEKDFLEIAREILISNQKELIPSLIELLSDKKSEGTLALLKEMEEKAKSPFTRNYCLLALFTLTHESCYEKKLLSFLEDGKNHALIQFKEKDEEKSLPTSRFTITPEEASKFLIAAIETLSSTRKKAALHALLNAISSGNPKNRFALAGLLIRTLE